MTMRRKLKIFGIVTLIVLIAVCGGIVNKYLSGRHLFIYATGTSDKAFLNATWKMSPQEIERVNRTSLSDSPTWFLIPLELEVTDQGRHKAFVQKDVSLWGRNAEIDYQFFDNMLYGYDISFTAYNLDEPHKEILETLRGQFGAGKEEERKRADIIYRFEWDTEKQTVSYHMWKDEKEKSYHVNIRALYKPFYRQIEEIAKNEKKAYF